MTNSSLASRVAAGRAARKLVTRSSTGDWKAPPDRRDPMAILEKQGETRLPGLVPIRYGRMAASEFAFLRGAPAIMAADLAESPTTGLTVQLCGDAHLSNFGLYASPERRLVFDLNDFDETLPGPFEWDVKRLTASIAVAARQNGFKDDCGHSAAVEAARAYRTAMARMKDKSELDVWYQTVDTTMLLQLARRKRGRKELEASFSQAERHTNLQALRKLTGPGPDGTPRIRYQPPLLVPFAELGFDRDTEEETIRRVFTDYRSTLQEDRRALLERFRYVESALKVVGVGSVGTRCSMALMLGETDLDAVVPPGEGGRGIGALAVSEVEPLRAPGAPGGRGAAADAGDERHLPGVGHRAGGPLLLRAAAARHEGLGERPGDGQDDAARVRGAVRADAGAGPRALRRPGGDLGVPGQRGFVRPRDGAVGAGVRGPDPGGSPGPDGRDQDGRVRAVEA